MPHSAVKKKKKTLLVTLSFQAGDFSVPSMLSTGTVSGAANQKLF